MHRISLGENLFSHKSNSGRPRALDVCVCREGTVEEKGSCLKLLNNSIFLQLCAAFNNLMCGSQNEHRLPPSCFGLGSVAKKMVIFAYLLLMVSQSSPFLDMWGLFVAVGPD